MKKNLFMLSTVITVVALFSSPMLFAQNSSPYWSLAGNSNATSTSKFGTTNLIPLRLFTNNTERVRIDSIGRVGIGITTPVNILTVKSGGGTPAASWLNGLNSPVFAGFGEAVSSEFLLAGASNTAGNRAVFQGRRSRGTLAAPAAVVNNDYLTSLLASAYDGSTFQNPALVSFFVDGAPSPGNVPTRISLITGSNAGNRIERLKVGGTGNFDFNSGQLFLRQSDGSFGIGTAAPNPSSLLEIRSTTKGLLTSRMTQAQRDAIPSPATGLLIYQTNNTPGFYYYNGAAWTAIASNIATAGWSLNGNAGTNPATNFIGTSDNQPLRFRVANVYAGEIDSVTNKAFFGYGAGQKITSGRYNAAFGYKALSATTSGSYNTANGFASLFFNITGNYNTSTGAHSLYFNSHGDGNTANGMYSLYYNTTGSNNTADGYQSLYNNTIANANTANGYQALFNNATGSYNTALGSASLYANTIGEQNTATGFQSLYSNTAGSNNTASGFYSLYSNNEGSNNTAHGYQALYFNTNGYNNVANGSGALQSNTTGHDNTANGRYALLFNNMGNNNTAQGSGAMQFNTSGFNNTAQGSAAMKNNSEGDYNTASGFQALLSNNTGTLNAAFGSSAMYINTTGFNNTAIGALATFQNSGLDNTTCIGFQSGGVSNVSNRIEIGNTSVGWIGGQVTWSTYSDARIKKQVKENVPGLDFITRLRPVTYHLDIHKQNQMCLRGIKEEHDWKGKYDIEKKQMTGFIAQEVEHAAKSVGYDFSGVEKANDDVGMYSVRYSDFVVPLVKAVQELSKMNDEKDAKIDVQDKKIDALQKQMEELKAIVLSGNSNNSSSTVLSNASLEQNRPNPFARVTTIGYNLPQRFTIAQIRITDNNGKTLKTVNISGSGKGTLNVDAATLASGAYNYSLYINGKLVGTKQMEHLK